MDETVRRVIAALFEMGIKGYTSGLERLNEMDPSKYPTLHARLYDALQKGEYRVMDIYESTEDGTVMDGEGNRYYVLVRPVPFERRLAYTFTYEDRRFALFHPEIARSLDERLAVEGTTDPTSYEERLREVQPSDVHIEGYRKEYYELAIPAAAFKRTDTLLKEYSVEVDLTPKMKELGVVKSYYVPIPGADIKNFPRFLPSPSFSYSAILAMLNLMYARGGLFIYAIAYSWGRLLAFYDFIKQFVHPGLKSFYAFIPPEEYKEQYGEGALSEIRRPEGVPKPVKYVELARFYNTLMRYEYEGKPLGQIKEEDPTLYAHIVRTFAYVEAQLKRWRATAFPYETIVGRYL